VRITIGKKIRLERIFDRKTDRTVIVHLDYVANGIEGIIANGGANAAIVNKGTARSRFSYCYGRDLGLILHLTASYRNKEVLVASVKEALKLGVDGVSLHVNVNKSSMLEILSKVSADCDEWGVPLLAMIRGCGEQEMDCIKRDALTCVELGADVVKINYTGDIDSFKEVIKSCSVPVVIAGEVKSNLKNLKNNLDEAFLKSVSDAMQAGAKGIAISGNIFQHPSPELLISRLYKIVHENYTESEAMRITEGLKCIE
jgi:fructose-bisphosphate aldolase/2-amino-3,7-dideoxy-D-threo-hept-6-ulosonate synthase